jgi:hypothetical protein
MRLPRFFRFLLQILPVSSLLIIGAIAYPRAALGMTWRELSGSLHRTFNQSHTWDYQNILGLALTLIIFSLLMACFKLYNFRQQKGIENFYHERLRNKRAATLPNGQTQKRQWFRLKKRDWLLWFHFRGFSPLGESDYKQDRMVDIGGGGLSFTTDHKLEIGAIITFLLNIDGDEPLSVWGRVVRLMEKTATEPQRYFVAIQFAELPDADRQRLVAWIMQGQRDARQTTSTGISSAAIPSD